MRLLPVMLLAGILAPTASGAPSEFRAPSGLRVVLDERHEHPLVRLELRVAWAESDLAPENQACTGDLLRGVLERCGAGGFGRAAFERTLAERGLRAGLSSGRRSLGWSMLADSQNQEDAFAFLAHAVFRPALAEGIAATLREAKASVTAEEAFRASLGFSCEGAPINELEPGSLYALHRRLVRPDRAVLIIQGDVSLAQARQLVLLHLGTWTRGAEPPVPVAVPASPTQEARRRTAPGGVRVAWAGSAPPEGDARQRAPHVMLALLLERAFRDEGLDGILLEAPLPEGDAGPILFRTHPSLAGDPERLLEARLAGFVTQGFTAPQLEAARRQWRAARASLVLHPEAQLAARAHGLLAGDPGAFLEEVRLEEVNAALRSRVSAQALRWLVQGPIPREASAS